MEKVAQNLHADFSNTQVFVLVDYFSNVTTEWEQAPGAAAPPPVTDHTSLRRLA